MQPKLRGTVLCDSGAKRRDGRDLDCTFDQVQNSPAHDIGGVWMGFKLITEVSNLCPSEGLMQMTTGGRILVKCEQHH